MTRRTRHALPTALVAAVLALPAAGAHAAFFLGEPVDGPSGDIVRLGDGDVARDGTGALAYIRRDGGVDHVFVSRLERGLWSPPQRIDAELAAAGAQPVVAAADGGRVAVAFISGGSLFAVNRPAGAPGFSPPGLVAASASNPAIDMSINGAAYLSFTSPGASAADVRVARLERDQTAFTVLADTLDLDAARDAGEGAKRSRVAISADGTGLVVWGESGADGRAHVIGRRVFGTRISSAPQDLSLPDLEGHAGRDADSPELDIEDDSSFAWVAFRQSFQDGLGGTPRTIARRLVGSQFETPSVVDGGAFGSGEGSGAPRVELNGRGEGIITAGTTSAFAAMGTPVHDDKIFPTVRFDGGNGVAPAAVPAFPETGDGFVSWLQGSPAGGVVLARTWDIDPAKRDVAAPAPEVALSNNDFGPVDPDSGFDAASNRAGDVVAVFIQGVGGERRLMSATFDRLPGTFRIYTTSKYRSFARTPLAWSPSFELWGPVTYRAEVDGVSIGETQDTKFVPVNPVPDGVHKVRVVATDRRGQTAATPTSTLRVDSTAPTVEFKVKGTRKAGRLLKISYKAGDVATPAGASGMRYVRVDLGDGTPRLTLFTNRGTVAHRFRRGKFTVRVSATDKAGNAIAETRRLTIKKR
jgi:hypothetical protein